MPKVLLGQIVEGARKWAVRTAAGAGSLSRSLNDDSVDAVDADFLAAFGGMSLPLSSESQ